MTNSSKKQKKSLRRSANRQYYPVFLDLRGKKCVVIGGGKVAERKCLSLLKVGARVTVVSPGITSLLEKRCAKRMMRHISRNYRAGDIRSAFVVIVATDSATINRKVASDAESRGVLVNVVDNPSLCNFIVPSVLRRGPLTIAVSTGGVSPAMARTVRKRLEWLYGTDFSKYLKFLQDVRTMVMEKIRNKRERSLLLKSLASVELLEVLLQKGFPAAKRLSLRHLKHKGVIF